MELFLLEVILQFRLNEKNWVHFEPISWYCGSVNIISMEYRPHYSNHAAINHFRKVGMALTWPPSLLPLLLLMSTSSAQVPADAPITALASAPDSVQTCTPEPHPSSIYTNSPTSTQSSPIALTLPSSTWPWVLPLAILACSGIVLLQFRLCYRILR